MLKFEKINQFQTKNIDEALEYALKEKENSVLIPLSDFMDNDDGLFFKDDKFITSNNGKLAFNSAGLYEFCRTLGLSQAFLQEINKKNLASKVINDFLQQEAKKEKLKPMKFVYNKEDNIITGMVSTSYVAYSNYSALADINIFELIKEFELQSAEFINSKMYIKLISNIECENKSFPDRSKKDVTKIGLVFQNSMVGGSSVKFSYYFYRLLCSNGLSTQASDEVLNVVHHAGKLESFKERINTRLIEKSKDLMGKQEFIQRLMSIPFESDKFYVKNGFKQLERFSLISRDEKNKRKHSDYEKILFDLIEELKWSQVIFNSKYRDKATMFDLINVFTEKANKQKQLSRKNEMQEDAGKLASWIVNNAEQFM